MPETETEAAKNAWLDRIPELEEGKRFPGMDPEAAAEFFDELFAAGKAEIISVIDTLREIDDGSDWKTRFLLHAAGSHAGHPDRAGQRRQLEAIYTTELRSNRPAPVKTFLVRQLQGFAGADSVLALAAQLNASDRQLIDAAAAALTAIGEPAAAEVLRKARDGSEGHARDAIDHALAQIG